MLLKMSYGLIPTNLWKSKTVDKDDEKTTLRISFEKLICYRSSWLGSTTVDILK